MLPTRQSILALTALVLVIGAATFAHGEERLRDAIDKQMAAGWNAHNVAPAELTTDSQFLRRVTLDLVGEIPSYDDLTAFVADKSPDKRAAVIDRLLADPRFAAHQARVWDFAYFARASDSLLRERPGFLKWMEKQFAENVPYDQWAKALLTGEGTTYNDGASLLLASTARSPLDTSVSVTRLFLGMQLQCARCHDHPTDAFTQKEFYGVAAFYSRLEPVSMGTKGNSITDFVLGEKNAGELMFSGTAAKQKPGQEGSPIKPKFPFAEELKEPEPNKNAAAKDPRNFPPNAVPAKPAFSRKNALAEWITKADNPYFAKAVANRVWGQFMGRGLAHPVDHISEKNPPSHPALLDELAKQMVKNRFDLKWYIREIVNSRAYQLSSQGKNTEATAPWFERGRVRPLSAEELADSMKVALDVAGALKANAKEGEEMLKGLSQIRGQIIRTFGSPLNGVGVYQSNIFENLYLNNDNSFVGALQRRPGNLLDKLNSTNGDVAARIDRLYLHVLSRKAEPQEQEKLAAYLKQKETKPGELWADAVWVLLASPEFRFNH